MAESAYFKADSPSVGVRIWRGLGFRRPFVWEGPTYDEEAPHWLKTVVVTHFDFFDRLRILVSGKVMLTTEHATDTSVSVCRSVTAVGVLPPFDNGRN